MLTIGGLITRLLFWSNDLYLQYLDEMSRDECHLSVGQGSLAAVDMYRYILVSSWE